jgi:uncharacterized membrane protein YdjX (TVP38/TMEM64 family)
MRRVLTALVIALVLYLAWAIWDYEALMRWMEEARPVPFFIAMALLPAIGAPLTPLFLIAGAAFGVTVGLIGTALALAVNLTICYRIGRGRLRRRLVSWLERFDYELPDYDASASRSIRSTIRFTTLVKVTPGPPGFVKNYALGASRVPFGIFFAISMLTTGAYAAALIVLGESLFEHQLGPGTIAILVVAVLAIVIWKWTRRRAAPGSAAPAS